MKRFPPILPITIIIFFVLSLCPARLRGAPNLLLTLEQKSIIAKRPFSIELAISWEGDAEQYLVENPRLIPPQGITLTGSASSTGTKGDTHILHYRYTLYPAAPGTYVLDPVEISYWGKNANGVQTVRTDALTMKVSSWTEAVLAKCRIPAALAIIFIGLFITAFVFSKKKKKAALNHQACGVTMGETISNELNQCRTYKISGDWEHYLKQVINIRSKLPAAENNEKSIDDLRKLAERVHFGNYHPTAEEINIIQRHLEKACSSFLAGQGESDLKQNSFQ